MESEKARKKRLEHQRNYRLANRQWIRERKRVYYQEHRAALLERQKVYNPRKRAYYQKHREALLERQRAYRHEHRTTIHARDKAYQASHASKYRLYEARRSARKRGLAATLTTEQWQAILTAYKHLCAYCRAKESKSRPLTQDHVIPLSKGGGTTSDNIVPACQSCNSRKQSGPPSTIPSLRLLL